MHKHKCSFKIQSAKRDSIIFTSLLYLVIVFVKSNDTYIIYTS